jgi:ssDNA-binding replication factor A large subunit
MQLHEIIERILSEKPNLKLNDVKKIIQRKMAEASGFLTEEGAAYVVASEMGISLPEKAKAQIRIKDLVSGLNNVTVAGCVLSTYPIQSFKYLNGETGKRSGFIMADKTGVINVVLWNEKAELTDKIFVNKIVKVTHGYVREGRDKKITIGVGLKGDVVHSPFDEDPSNYPETKDFFKKIDTLQERDNYVNVIGTVTHVFPIIVFERKGKEKGQVLRVNLMDETGTIKSVFWNDQANLLIKLKTDDCLQIIGAHVKRGMDEKNELHVDEKSRVSILKEKTKINQLRTGLKEFSVEGTIVTAPAVEEIKIKRGEIVRVASFRLKDATGEVKVSVWRDLVNMVENLTEGENIYIMNPTVKEGLTGLPELSTNALTSIKNTKEDEDTSEVIIFEKDNSKE